METASQKVTLEDVKKFVSTLDIELRIIYTHADRAMKETEDTLSHEFQLASAVVELFWERTKFAKGGDVN